MSSETYRKARTETRRTTRNRNSGMTVATPTTSPSASSAEPKTSPRSSFTNEQLSGVASSLNNSIRSLSISAASATPKEPRSQSLRQEPRYQKTQSVVTNSAYLNPIFRPDQGGSKGEPINVYTNHFRVHIDDALIYQYDIDIVMIDRFGKMRPIRKDERWNVIQSFVKKIKDFPTVWYDEGKTLYSREILPEIKLPMETNVTKDDQSKNYQLKALDLVRQDRIRSIYDFIEKKTNIRPREAMRIIEILFQQRARNEFISIRNQFYDRNRQLEDLGDGRGIAKGFYQALFLTQYGPTINVNMAFTCFYMPLSFIDFASKYLRQDVTQGVRERDIASFEKMVRNLAIATMHTGRRLFYRVRGFGLPADQIMFRCGDNDKTSDTEQVEQISVANYFARKYRKLRYPFLPCINATRGNDTKPNWLPMEIARIVEWQRALRPLDKQQRATVSRTTIIKPEQRYEEIMKIVRNNQYDRDSYLKQLNIRVDAKEMLELKARVLPSPQIKYRRRGRGEVTEYVECGRWRIKNWFWKTPEIKSWGIIYYGEEANRNTTNILIRFQNELPNLLERNGFVIHQKPSLLMKSPSNNDIANSLLDANKHNFQIVIVILDSWDNDSLYTHVKQHANKSIGVMTQCVNFQALKRNIDKLNMYVENLSQKINGKLGGLNGLVNLKAALSRSSTEDLFMFFGADVTHSTRSSDRPSIAAVVGSRDLTNNLYASRICEQYPKSGRCSIEIIKELDTMVVDLLRVFADSCGNRLPNKIVFYRDGVDEGQYEKVLDHEVRQIKRACQIVYGNERLPQLTFIVVKKRHNTRFFLYDGRQTTNVQAGTVVDQGITHPTQFDFYLCSQAAIMGTSRPALYHVLHDDIGFSSDDIQQLTYWLCHTDMRCSKSVSIPAPVHYAHLAAYASRILQSGDEEHRESIDEETMEPENDSLDDIKTKVLSLNEKIIDDMWFL